MKLVDADKLLEYLFSHQDEDIDIAKEIAEFPPVNQWIPCSERLPEDGEDVIVTVWGNSVMIAWRCNHKWRTEGFSLDDEEVNAWMPRPKPWEGKDESRKRTSVVY